MTWTVELIRFPAIRVFSHVLIANYFRDYPEQGGQVETVFDKFNKELHTDLLGYKGFNVSKRPKNAEKWACYTIEEYEQLLVWFIVDHWNQHDHPKFPEHCRPDFWHLMLTETPKIPNEHNPTQIRALSAGVSEGREKYDLLAKSTETSGYAFVGDSG